MSSLWRPLELYDWTDSNEIHGDIILRKMGEAGLTKRRTET